jgi:hypothetical protein
VVISDRDCDSGALQYVKRNINFIDVIAVSITKIINDSRKVLCVALKEKSF